MRVLWSNEKPNDSAAIRPERHTQGNLAASSGKSDQEEIGHIAARDQQHGSHRRKKSNEGGAQITIGVFRSGHEHSFPTIVDRIRTGLAITARNSSQGRSSLCKVYAGFQMSDHPKEAEAQIDPLPAFSLGYRAV